MKRKDAGKMFNLIDDSFLEEADPSKKTKLKAKRPKSYWVQFAISVACFVLMLNMTIMTPFLIARSKGSQSTTIKEVTVQNVIKNVLFESNGGQKTEVVLSSPVANIPSKYDSLVNLLSTKFPQLDNRLDDMIDESAPDWIEGGELGDLKEEIQDAIDKSEQESSKEEIDSAISDSSSTSNKYEETTDLQVQGVKEGDLLKRSSKYLYYLDSVNKTLEIYTIDKNNSTLVSIFHIDKITNLINENTAIVGSNDDDKESLKDKKEEIIDDEADNYAEEMFLSSDLKTLTIITTDYFSFDDNRSHYIRELPYVALISLNIEDPTDVYVSNIATLYGKYESARVIDNELFVFTKHTPKTISAIVPQYSDGEGYKLFDSDQIYYNDDIKSRTYLLAYRMNESTLKMNDVGAYLDFGDIIYMTGENIYLTREYRKTTEEEGKTVTEILRIDYSNGKFEEKGKVQVDGYLKDRFSLDEYDGVLRIVTTYDTENRLNYVDEGTSASIYCALVDTMQVYSSIQRFAPEGEIVRSVRFKNYTAYVCTSYQTTDPVFFFDLSNLDNLYYKETGTIPGYSNTLIDFNGDLLGIGIDGNRNLKLEVYRESEDKVVPVCYYIVNGTCSSEYKSYFIDREKGLIGLGVYDNNSAWPNRYILLRYTGSELKVIMNREVNGSRNLMRAALVDGWFYLISNNDFVVTYINNK